MGTLVKTISIVLGCCFFMTTHILAEESSPVGETIDYVSDAWEALHGGNHEEVVRLTDACFKECTEQALSNRSLVLQSPTLMQMNIRNSTV